MIYLFGDNRQLYPWELARTADSGSSFFEFGSDGTSPTMVGLEEGKFETDSTKLGLSGSQSGNDSRRSSSVYPDFNYFPLRPASESEKSTQSSSVATTQGGLYFVPAYLSETLPKSSRVWAPFTRLWNPIVARAQRDIVAAAAGYGLVVMCLTAAICLSVPNRRT